MPAFIGGRRTLRRRIRDQENSTHETFRPRVQGDQLDIVMSDVEWRRFVASHSLVPLSQSEFAASKAEQIRSSIGHTVTRLGKSARLVDMSLDAPYRWLVEITDKAPIRQMAIEHTYHQDFYGEEAPTESVEFELLVPDRQTQTFPELSLRSVRRKRPPLIGRVVEVLWKETEAAKRQTTVEQQS